MNIKNNWANVSFELIIIKLSSKEPSIIFLSLLLQGKKDFIVNDIKNVYKTWKNFPRL